MVKVELDSSAHWFSSARLRGGSMGGNHEKRISRLREPLVLSLAYLLGFVFLYSSSVHLANPYAFLSHVYSYGIVSERIGVIGATLLPSLQLTIGVALLFFSGLRRTAFLIATIFLLGFTGLQLQAWLRGLNISCGCFSNGHEDPINGLTIGRTALLFALSLVGFIMTTRTQKIGFEVETRGQPTLSSISG